MKTHKPFRLFDFLYEKILSSTHFYHSFMQLSSVGQWERWEDKVFEDLTGKTSVLVSNTKEELSQKAKEVVLDEVIAVKCTGNSEILFANDMLFCPRSN